MRIYWYWPTPHLRPHPWPPATTRPGDEIVVHALAPPHEGTVEPVDDYTLRRELPRAPAGHRTGRPRWWTSRAETYWQRARLRDVAVATGAFDLCHVHHVNRATDWWAIPRLRRHAPVVLSVHDVLPHARRLPPWVEDHWLHGAYHAADALVVFHDTLRDELVERFDVAPRRVFVLPHPIRMVEDVPAPRTHPPTVLFFGRFRSNKGIDVLLEAIRSIPGDRDVRFVLAGRGEPVLEDRVRDAASRDNRIRPEIGRVSSERRTELLQEASLLVLPYTEFHSQSGVLADAYSVGRPLVVTDVGALGATVREDRSGWVVPPSDPPALARTIVEVLADADARRLTGRAAAREGRGRSYEAVGQRLRSVYDEVARRHEPVPG